MSVQRSHDAWAETTMEAMVRRLRTYTSGYRLAMHIRDKWGMRHPRFGATDPLAYNVNPNPSGWHTRINNSINFDLQQVAMKSMLLDPTRRYEIVRRELRSLQPRSKLALEARLNRVFGEGHNPVSLVSELAGQPEGLAKLYGVLTWTGGSSQSQSSGWAQHEQRPELVYTISGQMLDDFLIKDLQTTLIATLLRT